MARNAFFQQNALRLLSMLNPEPATLFSYSYAAGELFRAAKQRSWITVLGQIDPGPEEERIVREVSRRHGVAFEPAPPEYWNAWRKETELADRIVVNSAWSKDCLVKEGIAEEKMVVVPLAYAAESRGRQDWGTTGPQERGTKRPRDEGTKGLRDERTMGLRDYGTKGPRDEGTKGLRAGVPHARDEDSVSPAGAGRGQTKRPKDEETKRQPSLRDRLPSNQLIKDQEPKTGGKSYPERFTKERPMRVLFLGQVNVRKGVMELLEAARMLKDEPIEFLLVGGVSDGLSLDVPRNVRVVGAVERGEAERWYREADVFVLPTHSDGFALTQLEAQARGLPVIASKYCGDVVRDGVNGVLLPEVGAKPLAEALHALAVDPQRVASMAAEAGVDERFSLRAVGQSLSDAMDR
jgi:glycosyltransferase involved in cell wall biosynthesis